MDTATAYAQNALRISEKAGNRPLIAMVKCGLGKLYMDQKKYGQARREFENALEIYSEDGITRELPAIYLNLGSVYLIKKDRQKALEVFQKAYNDAERMGMIPVQSEAAKELAALYEVEGSTTISNHYLKQYILLHDSIFTLETHRQLAEMQALHESQQQQLQITQLEQSNELNNLRAERSQYIIISLGGIVVIILLFAILFIRQIRIRNEQQALINQQRLFRSQMNPHFIFNSLTNIQHYIFSKDPMSAGKYLAIFAKLMRGILKHSQRELISLRDEIDTISQYLELQQLRMEDKLHFEVKVDESLDVELIEIPPMLAQPFIENAIEHGIRNLEGPGKVTVSIKRDDGYMLYDVEDNGVGRKKAAELKTEKHRKHESMAVNLTRSRLQNLWGRRGPGKEFEIIDLKTDAGKPCGTLVRFKVPSA
jgi:tetratricopeptide (TPR) repeat protein